MPFCEKCSKEIKLLGWGNHFASHLRQEEKRVKKLIAVFNALYPVGAKLCFRPAVGLEPIMVTVKSLAYNHHGNPVVWFEEKTSFCSIQPNFVMYPPYFFKGHATRNN